MVVTPSPCVTCQHQSKPAFKGVISAASEPKSYFWGSVMQIKHMCVWGPTRNSCEANLRGLCSSGKEFVVSKHFYLVWWSCCTEPRLTPMSNHRSTVTTCCPPAARGMVLITLQWTCFEWHIHKPLSLITANLKTKRGGHSLNTLLFSNTMIVPRCICFCPAALEAAGEEIISAPWSHQPKEVSRCSRSSPASVQGSSTHLPPLIRPSFFCCSVPHHSTAAGDLNPSISRALNSTHTQELQGSVKPDPG